mgnify:FL=1
MINFFKKKHKNNSLESFIFSYKSENNILNNLCKKYGCDKGYFDESKRFFSWNPHSYTDLYYFLFSNQRLTIKKVFELGIGTNKVFKDELKRKAMPGASLRVWKQFFSKAQIFGGDIDENTLFQEERIKTFIVDQFDSKSINAMWGKIKQKDFDLIIDDGCHQFEGTIKFFLNSIKFLSPNGFYIIEDVFYKNKKRFLNFFEKKNFNYFFVELSSKKKVKDNNLFIIKK